MTGRYVYLEAEVDNSFEENQPVLFWPTKLTWVNNMSGEPTLMSRPFGRAPYELDQWERWHETRGESVSYILIRGSQCYRLTRERYGIFVTEELANEFGRAHQYQYNPWDVIGRMDRMNFHVERISLDSLAPSVPRPRTVQFSEADAQVVDAIMQDNEAAWSARSRRIYDEEMRENAEAMQEVDIVGLIETRRTERLTESRAAFYRQLMFPPPWNPSWTNESNPVKSPGTSMLRMFIVALCAWLYLLRFDGDSPAASPVFWQGPLPPVEGFEFWNPHFGPQLPMCRNATDCDVDSRAHDVIEPKLFAALALQRDVALEQLDNCLKTSVRACPVCNHTVKTNGDFCRAELSACRKELSNGTCYDDLQGCRDELDAIIWISPFLTTPAFGTALLAVVVIVVCYKLAVSPLLGFVGGFSSRVFRIVLNFFNIFVAFATCTMSLFTFVFNYGSVTFAAYIACKLWLLWSPTEGLLRDLVLLAEAVASTAAGGVYVVFGRRITHYFVFPAMLLVVGAPPLVVLHMSKSQKAVGYRVVFDTAGKLHLVYRSKATEHWTDAITGSVVKPRFVTEAYITTRKSTYVPPLSNQGQGVLSHSQPIGTGDEQQVVFHGAAVEIKDGPASGYLFVTCKHSFVDLKTNRATVDHSSVNIVGRDKRGKFGEVNYDLSKWERYEWCIPANTQVAGTCFDLVVYRAPSVRGPKDKLYRPYHDLTCPITNKDMSVFKGGNAVVFYHERTAEGGLRLMRSDGEFGNFPELERTRGIIAHSCNTTFGYSGTPLWRERPSDRKLEMVGIHIGNDTGPDGCTWNFAITMPALNKFLRMHALAAPDAFRLFQRSRTAISESALQDESESEDDEELNIHYTVSNPLGLFVPEASKKAQRNRRATHGSGNSTVTSSSTQDDRQEDLDEDFNFDDDDEGALPTRDDQREQANDAEKAHDALRTHAFNEYAKYQTSGSSDGNAFVEPKKAPRGFQSGRISKANRWGDSDEEEADAAYLKGVGSNWATHGGSRTFRNDSKFDAEAKVLKHTRKGCRNTRRKRFYQESAIKFMPIRPGLDGPFRERYWAKEWKREANGDVRIRSLHELRAAPICDPAGRPEISEIIDAVVANDSLDYLAHAQQYTPSELIDSPGAIKFRAYIDAARIVFGKATNQMKNAQGETVYEQVGECKELHTAPPTQPVEVDSDFCTAARAENVELCGEDNRPKFGKPAYSKEQILRTLDAQAKKMRAATWDIADGMFKEEVTFEGYVKTKASAFGKLSDLTETIISSLDPKKSAGFSAHYIAGAKEVWQTEEGKVELIDIMLHRLMLIMSLGPQVIGIMTPEELVFHGISDPETVFAKDELIKRKKIDNGLARTIWPSSVVKNFCLSLLCYEWNKGCTAGYQRGVIHKLFTGVGHHDLGLEHMSKNIEHIMHDPDTGTMGPGATKDCEQYDFSVSRDGQMMCAGIRVHNTLPIADEAKCKFAFTYGSRADMFDPTALAEKGLTQTFVCLIHSLMLLEGAHTLVVGSKLYASSIAGQTGSGSTNTTVDNSVVQTSAHEVCGAPYTGSGGDDNLSRLLAAWNQARYEAMGFRIKPGSFETFGWSADGMQYGPISYNSLNGTFYAKEPCKVEGGHWIWRFANIEKLYTNARLNIPNVEALSDPKVQSALVGYKMCLRNVDGEGCWDSFVNTFRRVGIDIDGVDLEGVSEAPFDPWVYAEDIDPGFRIANGLAPEGVEPTVFSSLVPQQQESKKKKVADPSPAAFGDTVDTQIAHLTALVNRLQAQLAAQPAMSHTIEVVERVINHVEPEPVTESQAPLKPIAEADGDWEPALRPPGLTRATTTAAAPFSVESLSAQERHRLLADLNRACRSDVETNSATGKRHTPRQRKAKSPQPVPGVVDV